MNKMIEPDTRNVEIFSQNLKKYLRLSKKSQVEVANAIHVSKGTFCDWTRARSFPRMDKLQALADYFGILKSDLLEDENNVVKEDPISDQDQKALDLFHQVPEEKREFVLSLIQAAIDNL